MNEEQASNLIDVLNKINENLQKIADNQISSNKILSLNSSLLNYKMKKLKDEVF